MTDIAITLPANGSATRAFRCPRCLTEHTVTVTPSRVSNTMAAELVDQLGITGLDSTATRMFALLVQAAPGAWVSQDVLLRQTGSWPPIGKGEAAYQAVRVQLSRVRKRLPAGWVIENRINAGYRLVRPGTESVAA